MTVAAGYSKYGDKKAFEGNLCGGPMASPQMPPSFVYLTYHTLRAAMKQLGACLRILALHP